MRTSLASSKLYGVYRSNISKKIEKIVDSVAAWINAVRIATGSTNSRSVEIYKQHTKAWTKLAQTAKKEILSNPDLASARVGAGALVMVLDDCISCFNGRSQEAADRRKFFYINLLPQAPDPGWVRFNRTDDRLCCGETPGGSGRIYDKDHHFQTGR